MKRDIIERINELKKERNAVILVHNYQRPEVQDIADFLGDSLELSIKASKTDAEVIVFCGVYFMAETAKIISPQKTVLIPDPNAGCPMADMITGEQLRKLKADYPGSKVVCYVNSNAEVKAESDICCTSANSVKIVQKILEETEKIIFVPDKYLATYTASVLNHSFIIWDGYCPTHVRILPEDIKVQKEMHPDAEVLVHPECTPEVIRLAKKVLSTGGMCKYVKESNSREFVIGTESGIIYRLKNENPEKQFYPVTLHSICPNMKLTTLDKVLWALEDMKYKVEIPQEIIENARAPIQRMLEF